MNRSAVYRPEIDGLRAVAVVAVIINHFNSQVLPAGFLGVDIFFVISGYVITSSLLSKGQGSGFFGFLNQFYARRAKRLCPALFFYLIVAGLFVALFKLDPVLELETGISSVFGLSNIYLYASQSDYFAESAALNPFTQTWSLGVEEQFYLLFPVLIWFSGVLSGSAESIKNFRRIVACLSILSLLSFFIFSVHAASAAYYLMPMRFWEIGLGVLVCTWVLPASGRQFLLPHALSALVLFVIVGIMFLPASFANASTPVVVFMTALLLFLLQKGGFAFSFLNSTVCVKVGLMSYSLYLWHWGVLVLSRLTIGIHWWTVPFQLLTIALLSIFSYRFIEQPFRRS